MTLRVAPLTRAELEARIEDVARLRIEVFRAFPSTNRAAFAAKADL